MSLVEKSLSALEHSDCLQKSLIFDVFLIILDFSVRQKLHHVEIETTRCTAISLADDTSGLESFLVASTCLDCFYMKTFYSFLSLEFSADYQVDIGALISFFENYLISLVDNSL